MPDFLQSCSAAPTFVYSSRLHRTLLLALAVSTCARGQHARTVEAPVQRTAESAQWPGQVQRSLQWLVLHAPVIFSGEVLEGPPSSIGSGVAPGDQPFSILRMRVDDAVRGVHAGQVFSFAQWRGASALVLFPHERVILFLRQPNAAGMSSSVSGDFGLLRIGAGDLVPLRGLEFFGATRSASTTSLPDREADEAHALTMQRQRSGPCSSPGPPPRIELPISVLRPATALRPAMATRKRPAPPCLAPGPRRKAEGWALEAETMPASQLLGIVAAYVRESTLQSAPENAGDAHAR